MRAARGVSGMVMALGLSLALAVGAVVATPTTGAAEGSKASHVQRFALYTKDGHAKTVDADRDGQDSVGDVTIISAKLFTDRARTHRFGAMTVSCIRSFGDRELCQAAFRRKQPGGGQIVASGVFLQKTSNVFAVTGGTGRYRNVGGTVRVLRTDKGRPRFHFRLVRR